MIKAWLAKHPRFVMHFTPTDQKIKRGAHKSVQATGEDISAWIADWNDNPRPFVWTKTAEEILESLTRFVDEFRRGALARIGDGQYRYVVLDVDGDVPPAA